MGELPSELNICINSLDVSLPMPAKQFAESIFGGVERLF